MGRDPSGFGAVSSYPQGTPVNSADPTGLGNVQGSPCAPVSQTPAAVLPPWATNALQQSQAENSAPISTIPVSVPQPCAAEQHVFNNFDAPPGCWGQTGPGPAAHTPVHPAFAQQAQLQFTGGSWSQPAPVMGGATQMQLDGS